MCCVPYGCFRFHGIVETLIWKPSDFFPKKGEKWRFVQKSLEGIRGTKTALFWVTAQLCSSEVQMRSYLPLE
jgi:hypothetical protein